MGSIQEAQGKLADALQSYQADLELDERLAKSDSTNADWKHSLANTYAHIGFVLEARASCRRRWRHFNRASLSPSP